MTRINTSHRTINTHHPQHGAALLIMLIIMVVGITAFLASILPSSSLQAERDKKTSDALAQAKEALISYAINSENTGSTNARPGNFPCPDTNAPGTLGYGDEQPSCSSAGGTTIGRLPWRTLGIAELTDSDGEPLWYALSDNFRKSVGTINSDSRGSLLIYDRDGTTLLTPPGSEAVAIVFAPGKPTSSQQRNSSSSQISAANYLESAFSYNNASSMGPYVSADRSNTFNDRLIAIRTRDFMPIIERRVGKALINILQNYRTAKGYFPYPATLGSCQDNFTCDSNSANCYGRFPYNAAPANWGGNYTLPKTGISDWFVNNQWYRVIYYAVAGSSLNATPIGCSNTMTIDGNNRSALIFMPGSPLGNIIRTYANSNLAWYLEDAENTNLNSIYISPTTNSNDQIFFLP